MTSFLFGLRFRARGVDDFVTFDTSCACLIRRLSFFDVANRDSAFAGVDAIPSFRLRIDLVGCAPLPGSGRRGAMPHRLQCSVDETRWFHWLS